VLHHLVHAIGADRLDKRRDGRELLVVFRVRAGPAQLLYRAVEESEADHFVGITGGEAVPVNPDGQNRDLSARIGANLR
jgi:hypothetical protein